MVSYPSLMTIPIVLCSLAAIAAVDDIIFRISLDLGGKSRWYGLHSVFNVVIAAMTAGDIVALMGASRPTETYLNGVMGVVPIAVCLGLHLYHCLFFRLNRMDILHHSVMMGALLVPLCNLDRPDYLALTNAAMFFACGLPGAIDYGCMFLVEGGHMDIMTEKTINKALNNYLRSPGILYVAFMIQRMTAHNETNPLISIPTIAVFTWNAQYFSSLVSVAYGAATERRITHRR